MQKITCLLFTLFFLSNFQIFAQSNIHALTDYKTERRSYDYVSHNKEYVLVDDGDHNLIVLSVDNNGQLYNFFESEIPYCTDGKTNRTSINETFIMFYNDDHLIFQNFHNGEVRRVDNIPEKSEHSIAYLKDSTYYIVWTDSIYLYSIKDDFLHGGYEFSPKIKGNFIQSYKRENNDYKTVITNINGSNTLELEENQTLFRSENFSGIILQSQPREIYDDFSNEYVLYLLHQDGSIDTINHHFPKFNYIDKAKNDSTLMMISTHYDDYGWDHITVFYNYDITKDSLTAIDTISGLDFFLDLFITDSLILYSDWGEYYTKDLYSKVITKLDIYGSGYVSHHLKNKLVFMDFNLPIYVYDYKNNQISQVADSDVLTANNSISLFKKDKVYYFDLHHLEFPLYEVSDSIYVHHQEIAQNANKNGLRTSLLEKSNNYIYSFDDDAIVILDTTSTDGYRKKKIINHTIDLGCFKNGWYEYEDIIYGVIPIYKGEQKYLDLVSVNLQNLNFANLSEEFGIDTESNYITGSDGFIYWKKNIFDIKSKKVYDLKSYINNITSVLKYNDKIIIATSNNIIEFTYPEFTFSKTIDAKFQKYIGNKYFLYKSNQSNGNFWISDGTNHIEIIDSKDLYFNNAHRHNTTQDAIVLANSKTNQVWIYRVSYDDDGKLKVNQVYENTFDKIKYLSEHHHDEYICFSVTTDANEITTLFNLDTNEVIELLDINVNNIINIDDNQIVFINSALKRIEKIDFEGQVLDFIDYPKNTDFIYPLHQVNKGHKGLYILNSHTNNRNSKLVFDSEIFSFIFDSGCSREFATRTNNVNIVYKDRAYYFNFDLDEKGKQIYRLHNPYDLRTTSTVHTDVETISVYPNPVSGSLNIKSSDPCSISTLKIYDYIGSRHEISYQPCQTIINVEHLSQGAYFMEVKEGNYRKVTRFIKM